MNIKEKIAEARKLIAQFTAAFKFADYKLEDGTIVRVDGELAIGTAVFVIDAEGQLIPAPDGVHSLPEVGEVTTEGGMITVVPEVAAVVEEEYMEPADAAAAVEAVAEVVTDIAPEAEEEAVAIATDVVGMIQSRLEVLEVAVEEMKQAMQASRAASASSLATFSTAIKHIADAVEAIKAEPSAPARPRANAVVEGIKSKQDAVFAKLAEIKPFKK